MAVYFLKPEGMSGPIKIGSSRRPLHRLQSHLAWSPIPLEIIATIDGGIELERRFHARFKHLHSHGEWFNAAPELNETIARIQDGSFDTRELPEPFDLRPRYKPRKTWTDLEACAHGLQLRAARLSAHHSEVSSEYHAVHPGGSFSLGQAERLWRWIEARHPAPKSKSSRVMRRLLAERDREQA